MFAGSAHLATIAYLLPVYICQFRVRGWRCDMYYRGRPKKCTILQPDYYLFVASICMPISCLWLEVHYVLSWPVYLIVRSAPSYNPTIAYLLPVYQWDIVSTSETRSWFKLPSANISEEAFISYPSTYLGRISLTRRLCHTRVHI